MSDWLLALFTLINVLSAGCACYLTCRPKVPPPKQTPAYGTAAPYPIPDQPCQKCKIKTSQLEAEVRRTIHLGRELSRSITERERLQHRLDACQQLLDHLAATASYGVASKEIEFARDMLADALTSHPTETLPYSRGGHIKETP